MATLDKVIQLQQQGTSDNDIINQLKNEGVSPTEISDSINQAKIKNAVSPTENMNNPQEPVAPAGNDPNMAPPAPQGQPAMPPAPGEQPAGPEVYPPQDQYSAPQGQPAMQQDQYQSQYGGQMDQGYGGQDQYGAGQGGDQDYYQQTPQAYSDQGQYGGGGGAASTETISEIAEQVVTEKLTEYKQKVGDVASFNNSIQDKVNDIDDRLKRIEATIDKLQQAVIGKIGEFGESNAMIHKDLENLHGTVGKLMNPLVDTYKELKKKH